jgi:hypothetical protein
MTVAFLVLHELSAVVPLVAVFGIVHWTGTGDAMLDTVRGWLPPPQPPDPSSSIEPQPPAILASTLENATAKVAKIAARYGYHSPSNHPENEGTSSLDSAVFVSGLVAYLSVKASLPHPPIKKLKKKSNYSSAELTVISFFFFLLLLEMTYLHSSCCLSGYRSRYISRPRLRGSCIARHAACANRTRTNLLRLPPAHPEPPETHPPIHVMYIPSPNLHALVFLVAPSASSLLV